MENEKFQNLVLEHMARLTQDLTEIRLDVKDLRGEFTELKSEVAGLKSEVSTLKSEVAELKNEVADLNKRVTKIEIKLENEITPKIDFLYEGFQQHSIQLNRIEDKVSVHEEFIIKRIK